MRKFASLINMWNFSMWNYPTDLGRLEVNLRSLEVVIRTFLLTHVIGVEKATKFTQSLRSLKMDQDVAENSFTTSDTLSNLVNKYNTIITKSYSYPELTIDNNLIKLRDALAHGRAFYLEQSAPYSKMLLLKFSNPKDNKTTSKPKVVFQEVMTKDWLDKKIKLTRNEYKKVIEAHNRISKIEP